eukprot:TRINITY_DN2303_c0_g1_i1.p1 TRINITY_DN2303_c0_g1~~TRINITY_DN2303_c0_g1_i1.p1  ORF type:complete len:195 (+),score=63.47 TRINITY_DN2303_c0_g1_i1:154-738(+)
MVNLPAFCQFSPKKVQIGMLISTVTILVILIICFATFGWIDSGGVTTSLQEAKGSGQTVDLKGDAKDAAHAMAGLGAIAWICLFLDLIILVILLMNKFQSYKNHMLIAGMALTGLAWLFLTAGWGHYSDSKGGAKEYGIKDPDYGASFAFTVIMWLCLFPYAFFWFWLWNSSNCLLYTSPSPRDRTRSRMPSSA